MILNSMYNFKTDLKTVKKLITMPITDFKQLNKIAKKHDMSTNKLIYLVLKAYIKQYN